MKITESLLKRPVAVIVLIIAIFVIGLFSFQQLEVNYLPDITYPMIKVHIWWRGATPEEIETNIAEPAERVISTIDNLDYIESSSIEGMYTLLVNFKYGINIEQAYQDVIAAMGRVTRQLPKDMDPPVIFKADPSQLPVMELTISSDKRNLVYLRDWAENWLVDQISTVNGTAGAEVVGGLKREIRVHLDIQKLLVYKLDAFKIAKVLASENKEMFAGRVTVKAKEIIARTMGEFQSVEEIEKIVISHKSGGRNIYLKDIATIEDSHEEMRVNTRFKGKPCVKLNILKQADANTVSVSQDVKNRLQELRKIIPEDIKFGVVENNGEYVMGAINSVQQSAIAAAILVIIVVYLFLGRLKQVLIMLIALPVTLLANFSIMKIFDFSINIFSLGGLVVALGIILDNSIVVLENIVRLKEEGIENYSLKGIKEVGKAIIVSTLTFLSLFLPFLFVPGLSSLLFKELIMVIAGIVLLSLIIAITLTPFLADRFLQNEKNIKPFFIFNFFNSIISLFSIIYSKFLSVCIQKRWIVILSVLFLFTCGLWVGIQTGSEFLPQLDDGRIMVKVKMPSGTSVNEIDKILKNLESKLDLKEIESVFTLAGGKVWGLATYEIAEEGELNIQLVSKSKRKISTKQFITKIQPIIKTVPAPGGKIMVSQMKIKGIRQMGEQQVEIKIKGMEIMSIFKVAKELAEKLNEISGLRNVNVSMDMTKPEYKVYIDREKASYLGISADTVATTLRALVSGIVSTQYRDGSEYYNIRVMVPENKITSKQDLENLIIRNDTGDSFYLKDIAKIHQAVGPVEIVRENQNKQVIVRTDSAGISVGESVNKVKKVLLELNLPSNVEYEMGGQAQMMAENNKTMIIIILFATFFAYLVLAIQFESFILPVLILLNVPFTLTGSFIALYLTGNPIGVTVLIGIVVMMGGITSQGVVLLTLAESYFKEGKKPIQAILQAAPIRLRPILMTQLTTILGLVPLALNLGEGGDMLMPMAIAVIGGLLYSLILTLLFLPAVYVVIKHGD